MNACNIADGWFGNEASQDSANVSTMEEYVLKGGTFGTNKNRNDSVISDGRLLYLRKALFPPFKDMQTMFPWLKHRIFLPFAWVVRGVESFVKRRSNVKILLQAFQSGDKQNAKALSSFYESCGLLEGIKQ